MINFQSMLSIINGNIMKTASENYFQVSGKSEINKGDVGRRVLQND